MLADSRRPRQFTAEQYFKTQSQMAELFADIPQALTNTVELAKRCNHLTLCFKILLGCKLARAATICQHVTF